MNAPGCPERILYYWYFKALKDPESWGYEFLGWEDVDGHRCLKVQFDEVPGMPNRPADRKVIRFWIDVERGGNPLRIEFWDSKGVRMRTVAIALAKLPFPGGKERWFPVRGRTELFMIPGPTYPKEPLGYEYYSVLDGTVKFNEELPDEFFKLD